MPPPRNLAHLRYNPIPEFRAFARLADPRLNDQHRETILAGLGALQGCTPSYFRFSVKMPFTRDEGEGAPPYWLWVLAIRSYAAQRDAAQLQTEMRPGAAVNAEMVSELRVKLPDLAAPPTSEPEQARFRLFDPTTTFLTNPAQNQPLVLVLDDLHWADQPSLLLLEFLAREMTGHRLLALGCYRDMELSRQHPAPTSPGARVPTPASAGFETG